MAKTPNCTAKPARLVNICESGIARRGKYTLPKSCALRVKVTAVFVTHSLIEAVYLAERAIVLSPRPARIVADRALQLPRQRTGLLRTEAAFALEVRALSEALEGGGDG